MSGKYRLGFDIGGTFTDFVLAEVETGEMYLEKCLTTPKDPSEGVLQGINSLFKRLGADGRDINVAIHATTLITNALIERRGARTALITTQGFRDIVEMGTEIRYDMYDLLMERPAPLVARDLRFEVSERVDRTGRVVTALRDEAVASVALQLRKLGVESVAVAFLHAFRNPDHERRVGQIIRQMAPEISVSLSSDVAPEIREYERTSTTVANAYAKPITRQYLDVVQKTLKQAHYERQLYVMMSSGGISDAAVAKEYPIRILESGPAAGVLSSIFYARQLGIPSLVTFDMGGTTAKVGVVKDYQPAKTGVFEFGRIARFKKGSGLPVKVPMIELIEIGAGGGSIAGVDEIGLLRVGPHSASSQPGPACYGFGGEHPTVTDCNLVLGYLNADYFLGGAMKLDVAAARRAIARHVAEPMGGSVENGARGVFEIVNQSMLSAMKTHIAERDEDPRKFYLFAFGGAGPAHAYELARSLQMKGIIVPNGAGAASAMGLVTTGVSFDFAQSLVVQLDRVGWREISKTYEEMVKSGLKVLTSAGIAANAPGVEIIYQMDLRHKGQGHEVTVDVPVGYIADEARTKVVELFYDLHEKKFGHSHRHLPVQLVTCRATVRAPAPTIELKRLATGSRDPRTAQKQTRPVYFVETRGFLDTPIFDRYLLNPGMAIPGPAVIEERECTIVIGPSGQVRVDDFGTIFVDIRQGGDAMHGSRMAEVPA